MANFKPTGTVTETAYGKTFHGIANGSTRLDRYESNTTGTHFEHLHVAARDDDSRPHSSFDDGYKAACGCCYLHFPHTIDKHNQSIQERG